MNQRLLPLGLLALVLQVGCGGTVGTDAGSKDGPAVGLNADGPKNASSILVTRSSVDFNDPQQTGAACSGFPPILPPPPPDMTVVPLPDNFVPVSDSDIASLPSISIAGISGAPPMITSAYPDLDVTSEKAKRVLVDSLRTTSTHFGVQGRGSPLTGLNWAEYKVILSYPQFAYKAIYELYYIENEAGNFAKQVYPDIAQLDTVADAFRHAWGNILMCKRMNFDFARDFGIAHETHEGSQGGHEMDLHNNAVGRAVYSAHPDHSESQLRQDLVDFIAQHPDIWFSEGNVPNTDSLIYLDPQPPAPEPSDIVVDVTNLTTDPNAPGFYRSGTPRYWFSGSPYGRNHNMLWTYTDGDGTDNVGTWRPNIPVTRTYEVFVYIPGWYASTKHAVYEISTSTGVVTHEVNQYDISDRWEKIGEYQFSQGTSGYVRLSDHTGEKLKARWVGFDSVMFVPR